MLVNCLFIRYGWLVVDLPVYAHVKRLHASDRIGRTRGAQYALRLAVQSVVRAGGTQNARLTRRWTPVTRATRQALRG